MDTRLTEELEGSGGVLRASVEDFEVHEVLAYTPAGAGEHLFVEIEKSGITTMQAIERIARAIGISSRDVAFAGMKDRHARARQWISIHSKKELPALETPELRVLQSVRNDKKIRRGHQRANRFRITLRDVPPGGVARAHAVLAKLRVLGVPNRFGPQRFGSGGDNVERALAFVRGTEKPPRDRRIRDLMISAVQSEIFNTTLAMRIEGGTFARALLGDVMQKHDTGGLFDVDDVEREQPRVDRLEISPTAALPGSRYRRAGGEAQAIEDRALERSGVRVEELDKLGAEGTRRALRYPLDPTAAITAIGEDAFLLEVTLPSGAYATVLLDEIVKPPSGPFSREEL